MITALINRSRADKTAFPLLAEALLIFGKRFSADYGFDPRICDVQLFDDETKVPPGWVKVFVQDTLDVNGVLAYHDCDEQGSPVIYASYNAIPNGEMFFGPHGDGSSLLAELQHEWAETKLDPFANFFCDLPIVDPQGSGKVYKQAAMEACDPVQETTSHYMTNDTKCDWTNYVLPQWFNPRAPAGTKVDRIGLLPGPGTVAEGGYVIVREAFSEDNQVFARTVKLDHPIKMRGWRAHKKKGHSRTSRRLAEVIKL